MKLSSNSVSRPFESPALSLGSPNQAPGARGFRFHRPSASSRRRAPCLVGLVRAPQSNRSRIGFGCAGLRSPHDGPGRKSSPLPGIFAFPSRPTASNRFEAWTEFTPGQVNGFQKPLAASFATFFATSARAPRPLRVRTLHTRRCVRRSFSRFFVGITWRSTVQIA